MAAEHGGGIFADSHFWVLVSFLVFCLVAYKFGRHKLIGQLDARSARIRNELAEAEKLKKEAQALLADYQRREKEAAKTARAILDEAQATAERLKTEAQKKLNEAMQRKESLLLERIARAEAAAIDEIRAHAADIAIAASEEILREALARDGGALVDQSIADLKSRLN